MQSINMLFWAFFGLFWAFYTVPFVPVNLGASWLILGCFWALYDILSLEGKKQAQRCADDVSYYANLYWILCGCRYAQSVTLADMASENAREAQNGRRPSGGRKASRMAQTSAEHKLSKSERSESTRGKGLGLGRFGAKKRKTKTRTTPKT